MSGAKTFKHSGDMGDIIYSLPVVRALGGGVLYLDPQGGLSEPLVRWPFRNRTRLDRQSIDFLKPLLVAQPYIVDVCYWQGETVDYNLDQFRAQPDNQDNLADSHLLAFGLSPTERETAWLSVDDPIVPADAKRHTVVSRTVRHHGNHEFWDWTMPQLADHCIFVGLPEEYRIFVYTFGVEVPFYRTEDALTLARVIAGCKQFIGNESFTTAVAQGLKKNMITEISRVQPKTLFRREGAQYI